MALATDALIADLKKAFETQRDNTGTEKADQDQAIEDLATAIANAMEAYIKTGKVTVESGIPVTAAPYSGTTTGPGTGTID